MHVAVSCTRVFEYITQAADSLSLETYAIGGFVRDYFLQRGDAKDIDVVAVGSGIALAEEVAKLLPHQPKVQVFKTYGTAMLRAFDLEIEFVGARKESYTENSRNPHCRCPGYSSSHSLILGFCNVATLNLDIGNFAISYLRIFK